MLLSKRMSALADMVKGKGILADVGCDHGYIPIELVRNGKIKGAIALDVAQGPLRAARHNIENNRLEERIECRLSDGFEALEPGEATSIIISGMGGATMQGIMEAKPAVAAAAEELILQPQSEILQFRSFLAEGGYIFLDEDIVVEDDKIYPMMRVRKAKEGEELPTYSETQLEFGPLLLAQKNPVLRKFLQRMLNKNGMILQQLKRQGQSGMALNRIAEIEEEIARINEAMAAM